LIVGHDCVPPDPWVFDTAVTLPGVWCADPSANGAFLGIWGIGGVMGRLELGLCGLGEIVGLFGPPKWEEGNGAVFGYFGMVDLNSKTRRRIRILRRGTRTPKSDFGRIVGIFGGFGR